MSDIQEEVDTFSEPEELVEEVTETIPKSIEEIKVTEIPKQTLKGKKPRSEKQVQAFKKARAKLLEKRALLKSQSEESRALAKSEKYKSKKNKKLTTEVKQIMGNQRLMTEEDVVNIISQQKKLRREAKSKQAQDVTDAMKLLGISSLDGAKKIRKTRTSKTKQQQQPPPPQQQQPQQQQQPPPQQQSYQEPTSYFISRNDW